MDALYFLRHSKADDLEIRYSLRSIEKNCPFIRKVWVFGDRPNFLSNDATIVEHVPHEYLARLRAFRVPVTNFFLLFYLSSLIPRMDHDYWWFCDDFIVLEPISEKDARKDRYLEDLSQLKNRGKGLWKESLWRTFDVLKRLGYSTFNFENHVPTFFNKTRVLEAYIDFQDFITQDRWYGLLGPTAILNHAYKNEQFPLTRIADENSKAGFYFQSPSYPDIVTTCEGKIFLSFDDAAFSTDLQHFLSEQFPRPSRFERESYRCRSAG